MGELTISVLQGLPDGSHLTLTGWNLPATMSKEQWEQAGFAIARLEQSKQWWIGDWWNAGDRAWGDGRDICDKAGIDYKTARNCGVTASSFELSRRRDNLSFTHHCELCVIKDHDVQDRFLDACEKQSLSVAKLREMIRNYLDDQKWTDDEKSRRDIVRAGGTVLANLDNNTDEMLKKWAEFEGRAVRIDRMSEWGNPFLLGKDGGRDQVCDWYAWYLDHKASLQEKVEGLRGKVLLCWCYPERCHGEEIIKLL